MCCGAIYRASTTCGEQPGPVSSCFVTQIRRKARVTKVPRRVCSLLPPRSRPPLICAASLCKVYLHPGRLGHSSHSGRSADGGVSSTCDRLHSLTRTHALTHSRRDSTITKHGRSSSMATLTRPTSTMGAFPDSFTLSRSLLVFMSRVSASLPRA